MLVPREDEVHSRALQAFDRVAGVVDDVPLTSRAGDRKQVVVQHEDTELGGLAPGSCMRVLGVIREDFSRYLGKSIDLREPSISSGSISGSDALESLVAIVDRTRSR